MGNWSQKMRIVLTILLLGLSWHHVVLANHLACDAHVNCDGDSRQVFGAGEDADHEHCLVQIKPSRISDEKIKNRADFGSIDFLMPRSPTVSLSLVRLKMSILLGFRSIANTHFTESVRILS
jgi:hypothetical protein